MDRLTPTSVGVWLFVLSQINRKWCSSGGCDVTCYICACLVLVRRPTWPVVRPLSADHSHHLKIRSRPVHSMRMRKSVETAHWGGIDSSLLVCGFLWWNKIKRRRYNNCLFVTSSRFLVHPIFVIWIIYEFHVLLSIYKVNNLRSCPNYICELTIVN